MNPEEYEILAQVERDHWFYRGKRKIAFHALQLSFPEPKGKVLVDLGCGTGCFVEQMIQKKYSMIGVDDHPESIQKARLLLGTQNFKEGSAEQLPFDVESIDGVTMLDVLEHLKEDQVALRAIFRSLKPGGTLILTVPAFYLFWSEWDRSLHHYRRYTPETLLPILKATGFEVTHWNFINVSAFPVVFLLRQWREFMGNEERLIDRPENKIPWGPLNWFLEWQFVALAIQRWIRFPFGVSLLVTAKKPR